MGIKDLFKKKGEDVVDLADLQKRGIYKPKLPEKDEKGVMDFSKTGSENTKEAQETSALGFLSAMAESTSSSSSELESSGSMVIENKKKKLTEVLGNLKSDIKQNNDKVYKLIQRIDLLERKLDRIERRVGL